MEQSFDVIVYPGGIVEIDLKEGFSGASCVNKANILTTLIGGTVEFEKKKDSYYEDDSLEDVEVLNSLGL